MQSTTSEELTGFCISSAWQYVSLHPADDAGTENVENRMRDFTCSEQWSVQLSLLIIQAKTLDYEAMLARIEL